MAKQNIQNEIETIRNQARRAFAKKKDGKSINKLITKKFDKILKKQFKNIEDFSKKECCLLAIGGYGRAEMALYSDIDLLLISENTLNENIISDIVYPLWDNGVEITGLYRTIDECIKVASLDIRSLTSMYDSRYLAGSKRVYQVFRNKLIDYFSSTENVEWHFKTKLTEYYRRLARYGDSVFIREPHIKEGEGGLRSYQTVLWISKVLYNINEFKDLEKLKFINSKSLKDWRNALNFLWYVRQGMHIENSRKHDRLNYDIQEKFAKNLGYDSVADFMHEYYKHASYIHLATERLIGMIRDRFLKKTKVPVDFDENFILSDHLLDIKNVKDLKKCPALALCSWKICKDKGYKLAHHYKELIRKFTNVWSDEFFLNPNMHNLFRSLLSDAKNLDIILMELYETGFLFKIIPEFKNLYHKVQYDAYHLYTVDIHSIFLIREIKMLQLKNDKTNNFFAQVYEGIENKEILICACLLHDIGKGVNSGTRHDISGAIIAKAVTQRLGYKEEDSEEIESLVKSHLILSHLAFRRDIDDAQLIDNFANTVKTKEMLDKLLILTFADIRATGPDLWNNWKSELLINLYNKTVDYIHKYSEKERDAKLQRKNTIEALTENIDNNERRQEMSTWLLKMPARYLYSNSSKTIASHLKVLTNENRKDFEILLSKNSFNTHYDELTIITKDFSGLFAKICAVLTQNNINILEAQVNTNKNGDVVDIFKLVNRNDEKIGEDFDWEIIFTELKTIIRAETKEVLAETEKYLSLFLPSDLRKSRGESLNVVKIDNIVSPNYTVIETDTFDRTGLLFKISKWLFEKSYTIQLAKVTTHVGNVIDIFYITDLDGCKIQDNQRLKEIERGLNEIIK